MKIIIQNSTKTLQYDYTPSLSTRARVLGCFLTCSDLYQMSHWTLRFIAHQLRPTLRGNSLHMCRMTVCTVMVAVVFCLLIVHLTWDVLFVCWTNDLDTFGIGLSWGGGRRVSLNSSGVCLEHLTKCSYFWCRRDRRYFSDKQKLSGCPHVIVYMCAHGWNEMPILVLYVTWSHTILLINTNCADMISKKTKLWNCK